MKYKLELMEDNMGTIYGAVIDDNSQAVYFAPGFQHYLPAEIDNMAQDIAESDEFDLFMWNRSMPDPREAYNDFIGTGQGYEVIYDGVYFFPSRMNVAGLKTCGFTETGERKI